MPAEEAQEQGREGVYKVKQFLESTTHLEVPWTAYEHPVACKLVRLDKTKKQYDLKGYFFGKHKRPLYVEAKNYSGVGSQGSMYREYLSDVYSITAHAKAEDMDEGAEFMWVTWHPFSQGNWPKLLTHEYVKSAVLEHPECLNLDEGQTAEDVVDDDLCRLVADRLWLVVLSERQHELLLTPDEAGKAVLMLKRKGNP
jgi:hypothetical protein